MIKNSIPLLSAKFVQSPCIHVKSLFPFGSLASIACAVFSGSEEVPIQPRKFKSLTSEVFLTMDERIAEKCSRVPGTNKTFELCNASHS